MIKLMNIATVASPPGRVRRWRGRAALWAIALALLPLGCSKESKIARHTERADAFFAEGDYDKARLEYLNIVQLDPRNTYAIGQLGNIFFENGIVLQARAALEQALKLGATDPRLRARFGALLAASKLSDEARRQAQQALEADPTQEEALILLAELANDAAAAAEFKSLLGRLRAQKGNLAVYDTAEAIVTLKGRDMNTALALAERAVAASPQSASAQFVLAGIYLAQTNQAAGGPALARAVELSPPRSTRHIQYFNYLLQRGATNEAIAHLDQTIKAAPDFTPARLRKAQWAFAGRDFEAVGRELDAVLTRDRLNPEARILEAQLHLARREPARAAEVMEELIRQFPNSEQLQYQAALASLANQKANEAQLHLDRAYELNPNVPEVVLLRGRLYLARGQAAEAIASTQRLIATNATLRPAYQLLGDALAANGELDRAVAVFRDYERRFTNDPAGPQNLGLLHLRKQEVSPARSAFERAVALRPDFLPAVEQLVRLDLAVTNAPQAVARAQRFVEQHPSVAEGHVLLAQAQWANQQAQLAEAELEKAVELKPALQSAYLLLAQIYQESNRRDAAIQKLNALLERQPAEQRALMMLGILYTAAGDQKKAAESYETLLKARDSFSPALNNLAYLYSEHLDNLDRAYDLARKSRELQPDDPRIADTLGWILYRRGEYAAALVHLEESASRLVREGEVFFHLGMAHYAMAHEQPARAAFQQAIRLEPTASWRQQIDDRLAVLDASVTGDPETLRRLEQRAATNPKDAVLLSRFAQSLESAGQLDRALATFARAAAVSPDALLPLIGQARVTVAKGDAAAGLNLARKARDRAGNDPDSLFALGQIGFKARDYSWSYALLQEAVNGLSDKAQAQFVFGQAAIAVGRLDVARGALEKVTGGDYTNRAALQLRLLPFCRTGSLAPIPPDVIRQLNAAQPGELLADFLKARQLALAGQTDQAVTGLESILKLYPQFTPAKRSLATIWSTRPDSATQAEKLAREVREVQPNDAEMARVIGVAALARQDFRYAADLLHEASRSLPKDVELLILLGQARAQSDQVAAARQAFNQALALPLSAGQRQMVQESLDKLKAR